MSGVLHASAVNSSLGVLPRPREESAPPNPGKLFGVLAWLLVGLSILTRFVRYLTCAPLWGDENFQAAAFLDHDYLGLLGILPYEQVAPIGFLWIELTFVKLLGFHEWSLRLFPLLAGIGSVLLF